MIYTYKGQTNLFYDDVIEEKKKLIQEWESFVKNHKLSCINTILLPCLKIDKERIKGVEHKLFHLDTVQSLNAGSGGNMNNDNNVNIDMLSSNAKGYSKSGEIFKNGRNSMKSDGKNKTKSSHLGPHLTKSNRKASDPNAYNNMNSNKDKLIELGDDFMLQKIGKISQKANNESDDSDIKEIISKLDKVNTKSKFGHNKKIDHYQKVPSPNQIGNGNGNKDNYYINSNNSSKLVNSF
jgi:hypothetical protein